MFPGRREARPGRRGTIRLSVTGTVTASTPLGLYRQTDGFAYLRNTNSVGVADVSFFFGVAGDIPIAGELRRRWV